MSAWKKAVLDLLADTLENQGLLEKTKNCPTCYILKNSWNSIQIYRYREIVYYSIENIVNKHEDTIIHDQSKNESQISD